MTAEEARNKWCPMARIAVIGSVGYNRDTLGDAAINAPCLVSECMLWRWINNPKIAEKRGYCSLGGKP